MYRKLECHLNEAMPLLFSVLKLSMIAEERTELGVITKLDDFIKFDPDFNYLSAKTSIYETVEQIARLYT